jgi:uncharacterized pyridoxamine 5'-phosphate oxidase family protein
MTKSESFPHVQEFLQANHVGVLSTVGESQQPLGSAVYFVTDEEFNIYFVTRVETQKYKNIEQNAKVALTVVEATQQTTVQLSGNVAKLPAHDYADIVFDKLAALKPAKDADWAPPIEKVHKGDYIALKITPTHLQYANYSKAYREFNQVFIEKIV